MNQVIQSNEYDALIKKIQHKRKENFATQTGSQNAATWV